MNHAFVGVARSNKTTVVVLLNVGLYFSVMRTYTVPVIKHGGMLVLVVSEKEGGNLSIMMCNSTYAS